MPDSTDIPIPPIAEPEAPPTPPSRASRRFAGERRPLVLAILATLAMVVVYLGPRLLDINRMMVVDEALWLGRSANFVYGLVHLHPMDTYQFAHPGVTTMWAGAIAYFVMENVFVRQHSVSIQSIVNVHEVLVKYDIDPLTMLVYTRVAKLLLQTGLFVIAIWLIYKLFGRWVAIVTAALIAFDPFLIGHDRLLHIDGLLGITSFSAVLAFAFARDRWTNVWLWMMAGILFTLTCLTRSVGGIMLPLFAAIVLWAPMWKLVRRRVSIDVAWKSVKKPVLGFMVPSIVSAWILWPALLWAPGIILMNMARWSVSAAETGHELPTFFNGQIISGNPGFRFYPETMLWRMTPFTLAGLLCFVVIALIARNVVIPRRYQASLLIVAGFGLAFVLLMSLGAKKFDRYVLPAYPIAELIAAIGLVGLAKLIWDERSKAMRILAVSFLALMVVGQLDAARQNRPYGLDYYNPLLGGMQEAQYSMLIGWGEGLDQAADFIAGQADGENIIVRTSANRVSLLYFSPDNMTVPEGGLTANANGIVNWAKTDYYVAYTLQWQRDLTQMVLHHLAYFQPLDIVTVNGVQMARVYDIRDTPPPQQMIDSLSCTWSFDNQVRLLTYTDEPSVSGVVGSSTTRLVEILDAISKGEGIPATPEATANSTPSASPTSIVTSPMASPSASPIASPSASPVATPPGSPVASPGVIATPQSVTQSPVASPTVATPMSTPESGDTSTPQAQDGPIVIPGTTRIGPQAKPRSHQITLYFATGDALSDRSSFDVTVDLQPKAGSHPPISGTGTLIPSTVPGALRESEVTVTIPAGRNANLDSYWITVTLTDPITGRALPSMLLDGDGNPVKRMPAAVNQCFVPKTGN